MDPLSANINSADEGNDRVVKTEPIAEADAFSTPAKAPRKKKAAQATPNGSPAQPAAMKTTDACLEGFTPTETKMMAAAFFHSVQSETAPLELVRAHVGSKSTASVRVTLNGARRKSIMVDGKPTNAGGRPNGQTPVKRSKPDEDEGDQVKASPKPKKARSAPAAKVSDDDEGNEV
ncbi:hypothetical protein BT63DRAFT_454975 [Microthyrium microscopicum]|uniref:Uncharacterized protein n=1 Tax=Microthyrium microscopicum TaxID=703497 RepID=A0A6A6UD13_9PEZI|nr:hypothetical protein BT63DRAFT_454975 [Microthyrium microscopicum]